MTLTLDAIHRRLQEQRDPATVRRQDVAGPLGSPGRVIFVTRRFEAKLR